MKKRFTEAALLTRIFRIPLFWVFIIASLSIQQIWAQKAGPDRDQFKSTYELKKKENKQKLTSEQLQNGKFNFTASLLKEDTRGARLAISAALKNPTSLQFGPDGKLYVSQLNGLIKIFTIVKNGPNNYAIASQETITLINGIPNHNDDGTLATNITVRQVTGLIVTGTASNPILYVSSSDSRQGGPEGDLNLDTNSGIISKLTKAAAGGWDKVDLVRGLPRSEENHSINGMQLDGNMMYLAVGGITNAGSPSTNFAFTPEYTLTAAVLSIDLGAIEAMPTTGTGPNKYKYDLPTLDDPDRPGNPDANDPFGGNDGLNQAKIVPGGPVQVFASGFRNPYDLVITRSRKMYVTDNGANPGWGGYPENEGTPNVTNNYVDGEPGSTKAGPHDPKVNNLDHFHYIGDLNNYVPGSYYAGHPNPIRANPAGAGLYTYANGSGVWRTSTTGPNPLPADWPPVPVSMAHPIEGDFQNPGETNNALLTFNSSSNGIIEYTSSLFNNALKGHLLIASFDGNVQNVNLTADGTNVLNSRGSKKSNLDMPFASNFGSQPLDITAQGDNDIFPGTVWVVCYLQSNIYVFEPENTSGECVAAYSTTFDDDGDGYSNADEIDNGSNPCSSASRPSDADADLLSDLNDPDDDNDGLNDDIDYFALDASNGMSTNLPIRYELFNGDPGTGLFGLGFTGLMLPKKPGITYRDLFEEQNLVAGGAVGAFSVNNATPGDAHGTQNNQENGFMFGINTTTSTGAFTVQTRLLGPYFNDQTPQYWQALGTFIGTGDQDNYLKMTLGADGGAGGVDIVYENNGVVTSQNYSLPGGVPSTTMDLYLAVNPVTGMVQPKYSKDNGPITNLGPAIKVSGQLLEAIQGPPALAVGILSTSVGSTPFTAAWDFIRVTQDVPTNIAPVLAAIGDKTVTAGQTLTFTAQATDADVPAQTLTYSVTGPTGVSINASTGAFTWTPTASGTFGLTVKVTDNGTPVQSAQEEITITVLPAPGVRVNAGGATFATADGRQFVADTYFNGGGTTTAGNVPIDNTVDDALYQTERYGNFSYNVPVTNGYYNVILHFAETYSKVIDGSTTRKFNVDAEGVRRLTEYNIAQEAGGTLKAVQRTLGVTVTDGTLNVAFSQGSSQNPKVNAIEIVAGTPPPNQAPVLASIESQTLTLGQSLTLTAHATDGDAPAQILTYSVSGQTSATINPTTGVLNWTPTSTGTFTLMVKVTDNGSPALSDQKVLSVIVNSPAGNGQQMINYSLMNADTEQEIKVLTNGDQLNLATLPTRNLNIRANTNPNTVGSVRMVLSGKQSKTQTETGAPYSLYGDSNGNYNSWTPAVGNYNLTTTPYTGGGATGTAGTPLTISFTVLDQTPPANQAPVLAAIGNKNATVNQPVSFTAQATDPDVPAQALTYSVLGQSSATINPNTGAFSWTPTTTGTFSLTVKVTDNGTPALSTQEVVTVTVLPNDPGAVRINAGGPVFTTSEGRQFVADMYFNGGGTTTAGNVPIDNTVDDALYQTERYGNFSYNVPVTNGYYNVILHFAETYSKVIDGSTTRKFNVDAEGVRRLTEYNIAQEAGGTLKAVQRTLGVTVTDGTLNVAFSQGSSQNPKVNAIEIVAGTPPPNQAPVLASIESQTLTLGQSLTFTALATDADSPAQTLSYSLTGPASASLNASTGAFTWKPTTTGTTSFTIKVTDNGSPALSDQKVFTVTVIQPPFTPGTRINAGGPAYTMLDGRPFVADTYFTGGGTSNAGNVPIDNTEDDVLYRTERYGNFSYDVPVANGYYNVILHFAETYSKVIDGSTTRKFNVDAEGVRRLTEYNIAQEAGGTLKAVQRTLGVTVTDGTLNVAFSQGSSQSPKVNAIEIVAGTPPPNQAPVLASIESQTLTLGQSLTFTALATDADSPAQTLSYSLTGPASASLNASTGAFTWKPTTTGTTSFTIKVTDNGSPALSDQKVFTVTVIQPPFTPGTRINAGGPAYTMLDGRPFVADTYFTGGGTSNAGNVPIDNTEDDVLYRTERYGNFSYDVPVANGYYNVILHFAETYSKVIDGSTTRKFNVDAEGVRRLTEYNIAQEAGGTLKAVQRTLGVTVTDGTLNVAFSQGSSQSPKVNAIEIVAGTPPPNQAPVLASIESQTLTLGQSLTFTALATDADSPAQTLSYSLTGPASASLNASTGAFTWKPTTTGTTSFTIKVTDNGSPALSDQKVFTVTVIQPPFTPGTRINAGGPAYTMLDGRPFVADTYFTGGGTSNAGNVPIDNTEDDVLYRTERYGNFSYDVPVANGYYNVILHFAETYSKVIDGSTTRKFNVDAEGVRRLTEYNIAQEAGGTLKAVQRTLGVTVTDGTLNVAFSQGSSQSPKVNAIEIVAGTPPPNRGPVVAVALPDQSATVGTAFNYQVGIGSFTDADGDALTYTATLENNAALPTWVSFNANTRTFSGTPTSDTPASLTVKVTAKDGKGGTVSDNFVITITTPANTAPVLTAIGSKTLIVGQTLAFTTQAIDNDVPAQTLTYSLSGPSSASFNASTGAFSWTPTTTGTVSLTIKVTDNGSPALSAQEVINVTVNPVPFLAGTRINAGGPAYTAINGRPFVTDTYFNGGGTANAGNVPIDNTEDDALYRTERYGNFSYEVPVSNGYYNVTLHFAETYSAVINGTTTRKFNVDAEGVRRLTEYDIAQKAGGAVKAIQETIGVYVTDGTLTLAFSQGSSQSAKVNAIEIVAATAPANQLPVVANALPDQPASVGMAFSYQIATNSFTDADGDGLTYAATLENNAALPAWLSFDASTRIFTGTPVSATSLTVKVTANDGRGGSVSDSFGITVTAPQATNTAPVLASIGNRIVTLGQPLSFTVQATDSDVPAQSLTYSVMGPAGASINASTGAFSWTPTSTGTVSLTIMVTDNGTPAMSAQEVIMVTVNAATPTNQPPLVAAALVDQTARVGTAFSYQFSAGSFTDADGDALSYTASLEDNSALPAWLSFNASTRSLSGTPISATSLTVKVTATDGKGGSVSDSFVISISPANTAPLLTAIGSKTATAGQVLSFTVQATDSDVPAQSLTYSVMGPAGASINASTGAFSWTPTSTGTVSLTIMVTDNGTPAMSAQEVITVMVSTAPVAQQALISFSLINATTDQEIRVLTPGEQINLATLASRSINIRANTNPATVGSVRMVLSGKQSRTQTDNGLPYALFGDSNGNFNNWTPAVGSYSLTGTPYTATAAGGTAGTPLSISFTVIDQASGARMSAEDAGNLQVVLLGNPITNDEVEFEVRGANGRPLRMQILNAKGQTIIDNQIDEAAPLVHQRLSVAVQATGIFILRVSTPERSRTLKVIKTE